MAVTKIDAARRQLDCAIRLFFEDDDSLAIHTLAHASFKVFRDVYTQKWADDYSAKLNELMSKIGWRSFNSIPNFLKHADNDPDGTLASHHAEYVRPTIGLSCIFHHRITGLMSPEMRAFDAWMHILNPEKFQLEADPDPVFEAMFRESVAMTRSLPWAEQLTLGKVLITFYGVT